MKDKSKKQKLKKAMEMLERSEILIPTDFGFKKRKSNSEKISGFDYLVQILKTVKKIFDDLLNDETRIGFMPLMKNSDGERLCDLAMSDRNDVNLSGIVHTNSPLRDIREFTERKKKYVIDNSREDEYKSLMVLPFYSKTGREFLGCITIECAGSMVFTRDLKTISIIANKTATMLIPYISLYHLI